MIQGWRACTTIFVFGTKTSDRIVAVFIGTNETGKYPFPGDIRRIKKFLNNAGPFSL